MPPRPSSLWSRYSPRRRPPGGSSRDGRGSAGEIVCVPPDRSRAGFEADVVMAPPSGEPEIDAGLAERDHIPVGEARLRHGDLVHERPVLRREVDELESRTDGAHLAVPRRDVAVVEPELVRRRVAPD